MIPILYEKDGVTKKSVLNDSLEAYVTEERNGDFELELTYPVSGDVYKSLDKEKIIVCDANDYLKNQLFRIYNIRKTMKNRVKVYAKHISFDLAHDWIDSISLENQPCEYALNTIFRNSQFCQHYKGYSDIVNAQNFKVNKVTCLKAIAGTSGSIIDTYGTGAEILRDNANIHVLNRRGHDNDVVIEYRKNLTGLEVEEDTTDLVTRIMPYAIYTDEDSQEVEVRGDFVDSPLINNYAHPYVKYIDYSDKFENDEIPTKTKLNNLATKEYTVNKVDIPKCNYKIEFIPLSKCAGYEGLEDRINLCDVVTVKDSRYNIDTQAKVIKVVFDVLRGRYDSMELGEPRTTLGDIIGGTGDGPVQGPPGPPGPQGPAGADGSIGDFPETLPEVPNITAKVYGFANIELSWTFENKIYYSYELYASKTKGFVPNTFNLIFSGQASTYLYQAEPNETWYFRACALNTHGQRTEFSEEVEASTVKISDLSNYVESAAIGDALIGELNLGRGWVGQLRGNWIDAKQLSVTDENGKRTLDIDSFGNVNLDVTSLKIKSNSVATQSQVQQTADNIQFKFTQTGGYNLIRNGNPKPNNYSHWWVSGNANWYLGSTTDIGVQTLDTNEAYAGSATFKVEPGKTYSFSCWLMAETNTKGTDVWFIGSANDDGAYTEVHNLYTSSSGDQTWHQVKASFTVGSNINYGFIRIDNNGRKDTSNGAFTVVFFSEVQMVKGQDYFPQWSPNPNEVYDGITTIDKSGIKVNASNINGYTKMTANGFFVNKDGKDLASVDGYGLRLFDAKIQLTHANGNKYFLLDENGIVMYNPANGTHQWGKVSAINNKFTVASNGNSNGLSLGHHVNENYVEDILCDSNGVVTVQRQMNHNGVFYNNYGQMFVRQPGQGGWEITGRSDSQSIKPDRTNQGAIGSDTQYINQSWIANRYNPSSLEFKHLSHYVDDLECLKLVSEVQPARYFYKEYDEEGNDITTFTTRTSQLGLIYEDVRECTGRDLITNEEDKAINLYNMVSTLWGAVRNLNQRLNELEIENLKLNNELEQIKATQKEVI